MTKTGRLFKRMAACAMVVALVAGPTMVAADIKAVYDKQCAKCHGKDGKGQTTMGKKLKAKDYTDPKVQEKLKDEDMIKITKEGKKKGSRTLMKGYAKTLSEQEIKDLVAYIRKFKKQ